MVTGLLLLGGLMIGGAHACAATELSLSAATAQYAVADRALNQAWKTLGQTVTGEPFKTIRTQQRSWIAYRDLMATVGAGYARDAIVPQCADVIAQKSEITQSRTRWLKARASADVSPWQGRFDDSFGGDLLLYQSKGLVVFELSVVRSEAYHTGEISGIVRVNGDQAVYRTETMDGQLAEVKLHRRGQMIEVETENTASFGGMRAYFSGGYGRAAELTAEQRKRLAESLPGAD